VVTDVEMPVMDGITLVEQIRFLESPVATVPVITASGNADDEMRRKALDSGSDVFLTKPFDLGALRREIASLLKKRRRGVLRDSPLAPGGLRRLDSDLKIGS